MIITYKAGLWKGLKLNKNWRTILLRMNTIYPLEFWRAVSLPDVIRGSKRARATTEEISTNIKVKRSVIVE